MTPSGHDSGMDEVEQDEREITPKQEAFCQEYLKDLNATQAAVRTGYSEKTANEQGSRLLAVVSIRARVDQLLAERVTRTQVTQDQVINELRRIAFGGMGKLATWNQSGVSFRESSDLDEDTLASVAEVSETVTESGGTLKIRQYDKVKALELLGKHLKMFTEKHEHSGPNGKPIELHAVPNEQLDARIAELQAMITHAAAHPPIVLSEPGEGA